MKDKENQGPNRMNLDVKQFDAQSKMALETQVRLVNQQQEESKGPNKAQQLFKSGLGNFRCDACEESFYSKKEYERHSKTAIHKALRTKRRDEKAVEQSISHPPARSKPCAQCGEHIKFGQTVPHNIEKHGCIDF